MADDQENSPLSAARRRVSRASRKDVASMLHMKTVTPRSIAYAAIMVCHHSSVGFCSDFFFSLAAHLRFDQCQALVAVTS